MEDGAEKRRAEVVIKQSAQAVVPNSPFQIFTMNKINIQRDKQGRPIKIDSELMGTYQHSIGGMSQPRLISNKKNVLRKKYLLTYENNGACNVSRIISNDSVILFDDALCAELSSMLSKFSETEANRIITQMTSVVANFKKR